MLGPIPYIGGRSPLCRTNLSLMPPHPAYVEGFAGGAQLLFRKTPPEVEVINDISDDVVIFFRVVQHHWEEFVRCLRFHVTSRTWFRIVEGINPRSLTDIQRAARFYYLQKSAFGGLIRHRTYHYGASK